jgi:pyroglutamyl-peptidase
MWGKYPDANGYTPDNVAIMDENVPYEIKSKAPHQKMLRLLHANGIPAELSNDADTFMCNALGYKTSLAARKTGCPTRNIFIHIPWTTEYQDRVVIEKEKIFLPSDLYYKGLELLIRNI